MPKVRPEVVKRLREAKGWSQQALAEEAIVSLKTINSMERGAEALARTIGKVAEALGVPPADLIAADDPPPSGPVAEARPNQPVVVAPPPPAGPAVAPTAAAKSGTPGVTVRIKIPPQPPASAVTIESLTLTIRTAAGLRHPITLTKDGPDGVSYRVSASPDDAARIAGAFVDGKLRPSEVTQIALAEEAATAAGWTAALTAILGPAAAVLPAAWMMLKGRRGVRPGVNVSRTPDGQIVLQHAQDALPPPAPEEG